MIEHFKYLFYSLNGDRLFRVADHLLMLRSMVPDGKAVRIALSDTVEVCLTRTGNRFYCFVNKCPHQGLPLHQGECAEGTFTCPFHRHRFDLKTGTNQTFIQPEKLQMIPILKLKSGVYLVLPKKKL